MAATPDPAPTRSPADPQDALGRLGGSWTWALGLALVTLAAGVLVLVWPGETLQVLAVIVGLQLLVTGVFRFVSAFSGDRARGDSRATVLIIAVLAVLAGVLCLRNPLQTITALTLVVGTFWLVSGLLTVFVSIMERDLAHRATAFATGVLGMVAGIVVLAFPVQSAVALTRLLGLWLVLLGIAELTGAVALRSVSHRISARAAGAAAARQAAAGTGGRATTGGRAVGGDWDRR
ncbi:HdeD family acid-resistance protein [Streptomyces thermolineatus]|uniref:HdeD family acid-resistance protein n=1 Tax=Streptomyces thermolineatus TaxID=44033 RepID=A0ABN3L051_9ACTN